MTAQLLLFGEDSGIVSRLNQVTALARQSAESCQIPTSIAGYDQIRGDFGEFTTSSRKTTWHGIYGL
jgi:hypothetical protein